MGEAVTVPGLAVSMNASFLGYFAHGGFMAGLEEAGVRPGYVSGASAGAFIAGLAAAGMDGGAMRAFLFDKKLKWQWVELGNVVLKSLPVATNWWGFTGVMTGDKILGHLRGAIGERRIEDCREPVVRIAATNMCERRVEMVSEGELAQWMVASCAFPSVIAHRQVGRSRYWDGGIGNPLPMGHWVNEPEVKMVVAHHVMRGGAGAGRGEQSWTMSRSFAAAHEVVCGEITKLQRRELEHGGVKLEEYSSATPKIGFWGSLNDLEACWEAGRQSGLEAGERVKLSMA